MKKTYIILMVMLFTGIIAKAQDTLIYEDFNDTIFAPYHFVDLSGSINNTQDSSWYNFDGDGLFQNDASTPQQWFFSYPFSAADAFTPKGDSNVVFASSSYFTTSDQADNWFISPSVKLGDHDTLFWKSAPSQTPRFLDGYEVLISNTTNNVNVFSTVLFTAAEMTGVPANDPDTVYADFTFSSNTAFIHGLDGLYIDAAVNTSAPTIHTGQLRPFSVSLDAYANQTVFIAFHHNSFDDNLISIDDIMIRGTKNSGIKENNLVSNFNLFPNPVVKNNNVQVDFELALATNVNINVYDVAGRLMNSNSFNSLSQGRHFANINTATLAKGFYTVEIQTANGNCVKKLMVQ